MYERIRNLREDKDLKQEDLANDELLTLSTCEYSYENGRFVVLAKKITE